MTNSKRRRAKAEKLRKLQEEYEQANKNKPQDLATYDVADEQQPIPQPLDVYDVPQEQTGQIDEHGDISVNEIPKKELDPERTNLGFDFIDEFNEKRKEQFPYPSLGDNIEEVNYSQEVNNPDSEKTKQGQNFGFIRNSFDDASDNYKTKLDSKGNAFENYLTAKPNTFSSNNTVIGIPPQTPKPTDNIQSGYVSNDKFGNFLDNLTKATRRIGSMGGHVTPSRMLGMYGSVLGPWPQGVREIPGTSNIPDGVRRGLNMERQSYQPPKQEQYAIPEKYMQPGVEGSQVPKHSAAPRGSTQGTTWQRVVTVDQYGKKRSALRKVRVPDLQYARRPAQQQGSTGGQSIFGSNPFGTGNIGANVNRSFTPQESPFGIQGFNPSNLTRNSASPNMDQNMNAVMNMTRCNSGNPDLSMYLGKKNSSKPKDLNQYFR